MKCVSVLKVYVVIIVIVVHGMRTNNIILDLGTEKKKAILIQWNNDGSALVQIGNKFGTYNASQIEIGV
jgi:hypothetical protein